MNFLKLLFAGVAASAFLLASCGPKKDVKQGVVVGATPLQDIVTVNSAGQLSSLWTERGYKKITVIRISANSGLAALSGAEAELVGAALKKAKPDKLKMDPVLRDNSSADLFMPLKAGVVKSFYWVVPFRTIEYYDAERRLKLLFNNETAGVHFKDIDPMKYDSGCVRGAVMGVAAAICSPLTLPPIKEPVVLSFDPDFFAPYSSELGITKLAGLRRLFEILEKKGVRVSACFVSAYAKSAYAKPYHKYLAGQIVDVLKDPGILKKAEPPAIWSYWDNADRLILSGEGRQAVKYISGRLKDYPKDEHLKLFLAEAQRMSAH
ncbi:MAG: hypothetical protein EPN22_04785 [Nitrospirae bacterium]|nr:MAG: hypothetical protein EPN22_04785 [Nitrospirota bacterium]